MTPKNKSELEVLLEQRDKELKLLRKELHETRIAIKVLLHVRNDYREIIKQNALFNIERLVKPYLHKLEQTGLDPQQQELLKLVVYNLDNIISPGFQDVAKSTISLSPTELQVANLIKLGKTNKEIASILDRSLNTIQSHRFNLRKKLGLRNRKVNLRSYLETHHSN
jgi:DNA-binding CsgD family transcriptional regulator